MFWFKFSENPNWDIGKPHGKNLHESNEPPQTVQRELIALQIEHVQ